MPDAPLNFPAGFLWGAATAAHQIEGNNVNNDWWPREHSGDARIAEPSGDACDSYHRYREDMTLLRDAGLGTYRFSIEWSRIEPEEGHVSRAAIDHYRRMVDTALELGVTPMVTLMHFTVPRWFAQDGMWRSPKAADRFARFTELALPVLGDDVKWVCTVNEPNIAAMIAGGEDPANLVAYALPAPDLQVADTLLECHRRSREVLSGVGGVRSGWTVATQAFQAEPGCAELAHEYGYRRDDWYPEAAAGDDARRIDYTRGALTGLHAAIEDGVKVEGYLHWSLLDNFEWTSGYRPTFGLVAVDRATFVRTPKPSLGWLGRVAAANGLSPRQA